MAFSDTLFYDTTPSISVARPAIDLSTASSGILPLHARVASCLPPPSLFRKIESFGIRFAHHHHNSRQLACGHVYGGVDRSYIASCAFLVVVFPVFFRTRWEFHLRGLFWPRGCMEGVVGEVYSMFNSTSESLVYHCLLRRRFFQHAELNFVTSAPPSSLGVLVLYTYHTWHSLGGLCSNTACLCGLRFGIKSIALVTWLPRTLLMYIYLRSERCLV